VHPVGATLRDRGEKRIKLQEGYDFPVAGFNPERNVSQREVIYD
jgi:hypothetical protein